MIAWYEIDTVLLDLDGTLLDLRFDNFFWQEYLPARWGEEHGLDADRARAELLPRLQSREGTLSWYCLDHWSRELGMDILGLKADIEHMIQTRPHAADFLSYLRLLGKQAVLVTNSHERLLEMKLLKTGIRPFFERIVSSHSIGLPKEEPAFWTALREHVSFDPARTILIDDNLSVLRAAQRFGLKHLWLVAQPDSELPPRLSSEFPLLDSFQSLMRPAGA